MRVKWRTTSTSETSGTPARSSSRRRYADNSSSIGGDRRAHDELVEARRGEGEREACERCDRARGVSCLLRALHGDLLQAPAPKRLHVDGRGKRDEALVCADVRGRLLAPYVLLAR